ncbi:MAG: hypothetical protein R6U21_05780 [Thermoplasmatota archaeon]
MNKIQLVSLFIVFLILAGSSHHILIVQSRQTNIKDETLSYALEFIGDTNKKEVLELTKDQVEAMEGYFEKTNAFFSKADTVDEGVDVLKQVIGRLKTYGFFQKDASSEQVISEMLPKGLSWQHSSMGNWLPSTFSLKSDDDFYNSHCLIASHFKNCEPFNFPLILSYFLFLILVHYYAGDVAEVLLKVVNYWYQHTPIHLWIMVLDVLGEKHDPAYWFSSLGLNGHVYISPFTNVFMRSFSGIKLVNLVTNEGYCFGFALDCGLRT